VKPVFGADLPSYSIHPGVASPAVEFFGYHGGEVISGGDVLHGGEVISGGDVLPGLELSVTEVFA